MLAIFQFSFRKFHKRQFERIEIKWWMSQIEYISVKVDRSLLIWIVLKVYVKFIIDTAIAYICYSLIIRP